MAYQLPGRCGICGHDIIITDFYCPNCNTRTEGRFTSCRFCSLNQEQLDFIEAFLKCRGNIKDVEKELGISYPTIRNRLEDVLQALGLSNSNEAADQGKSKADMSSILAALEQGEISPQEALKRLKGKK